MQKRMRDKLLCDICAEGNWHLSDVQAEKPFEIGGTNLTDEQNSSWRFDAFQIQYIKYSFIEAWPLFFSEFEQHRSHQNVNFVRLIILELNVDFYKIQLFNSAIATSFFSTHVIETYQIKFLSYTYHTPYKNRLLIFPIPVERLVVPNWYKCKSV